MRVRDWYFQGWERRADAAGKSGLVYAGEYYRLPGGAKRPAALMTAGLAALYLAVAVFPSQGGMWRLSAPPQLLEIIPLVYLVMGLVCLLRAPERMTYRDWHASWRRMRLAALWSAGLTALMVIAELTYLILYARAEGASPAREALYLAGELVCVSLSVGLTLFIQKHPCSQSAD